MDKKEGVDLSGMLEVDLKIFWMRRWERKREKIIDNFILGDGDKWY